jgi:ABC-2 type transport system ATP-binding protein
VPAIRATGLEKSYGDVDALTGMSLSVERGEVFGFLGANGAGKTTTIEVLTGQVKPDGGEASVLGVDPAADPVGVRERVGVLPERQSPPDFLTPREYFSFVGRVRRMDEAVVAERVDEWADRLAFAETLDHLCADLSRGQQQKAMIAAAFLHDPAVVFVDEPLANLDPLIQERAKALFREHSEAGNALVLSTHHVELAAEVCTRVGIVAGGRLRAERDPSGLDGEALRSEFLAVR